MNTLARHTCFLILFLMPYVLPAQDPRQRAIPPQILATLNKLFPEAAELDLLVNENELGVSFLWQQQYYDAFFTRDGEWLRTEYIIDYEELPEQVRFVFELSEYSTWERGYAYHVTLPGRIINYKIYVYDANWNELELVYDENGRIVISVSFQ